jgi:hypothetical protein
MRVLLCGLALAVPVVSRELLLNGNFEQEPIPAHGWTFATWGNFPDTGNCRLRWRHDFHPDRDFEVMLQKTLHEGTSLSQVISPPSTNIDFDVTCRLVARTTSESLFAAACISLEYRDRDDSVLGETRILYATSGCDWQNGPALHLLPVADSLWHDHHLRIAEELTHLPAVNPADIKTIRVSLLSYVKDNC